jgi:hypothetical protein
MSRRITHAEFLKRAQVKHGRRYNYSDVKFETLTLHVCIICKIHGNFEQRASDHLAGNGCPRCAGKGLTTEDWIARFRQGHGESYDYTEFQFFGATKKGTIICREHGRFLQTPHNHRNGRGCPACSSIFKQQGRNKLSIFVEEGTRIHNGKYQYGKATFRGAMVLTTITCPIHGDFEQTPQDHVVGRHGCGPCAVDFRAQKKFENAARDFEKKAQAVHGNLYDYSQGEYAGSHEKLGITCIEHGLFYQSPTNHLSGRGCPKCKGGVATSLDDWLQQAQVKFGDHYDYSRVSFSSVSEEIEIGCPSHGWFKQRAFLHLLGLEPCPSCRSAKPWTKQRFLEATKEIHGDKYRYSNLPDELKYETPVQASCPDHGNWTIPSAGAHASIPPATGCPECGRVKSGLARRLGVEQVHQALRKFHGTKYDLNEVAFVEAETPIRMICPIHGAMISRATNLLKGDGCLLCNEIVRSPKRAKQTKKFVTRADEVHNGRYDYAKTVYCGIFDRIIVICPEHGDFIQIAKSHSEGGGCPRCAKYGFDPDAACEFYYAKITTPQGMDLWMIGISKNGFEKRYTVDEKKQMQLLKRIKFDTGLEALAFEQSIKRKFSKYRYEEESPLKHKKTTEIFCCDILNLG